MIEEFKYSGVWWSSDDPETYITGILTYIPNRRASLEIAGKFNNPKIIYGYSSNGKKISLHNCHQTGGYHSIPGFTTAEYSPEIIFIGDHISEALNFTEISIHYSYLDQWLDLSGFRETNPSIEEIEISYKKPENVEVRINEDYIVAIEFSFSFKSSVTNVKMHQTSYITVKSLEGKPLEEYDKLISQTMTFLSLAVREPVYPLTIHGRTKSMPRTLDSIEIYYPYMYISSAERSIHPLKMLFTYGDIYKSIDEIFKNWFLKAKSLEPTFNLYFDTIYTPRLTIQGKFLNMVQALESYHRRKETMQQLELPEEEHRMRVESIIATAAPTYREWLRKKLEYSNEVRLNVRLKEILSIYEEIIQSFLPGRKMKNFRGRITECRHLLTHYDPKKKQPEDRELADIFINVKKIVELCLLTEIGFDNTDIMRILNKDKLE